MDKNIHTSFFTVLQEYVDDVTIVQEKKGNCDEVNIDKVCFVLIV